MHKTIKVVLAIAGCLLLIGIIFGGVGFALGGMKSVQLTTNGPVVVSASTLTTTEVTAADLKAVTADSAPLTALDLQVDLGDVTIKEGAEFSLVCIYNSALTNFDWSCGGGELTVRNLQNPGVNFLNGFGFNLGFIDTSSEAYSLVITLPKGSDYSSLRIRNALGNVTLEGLSAKELNLTLNLGSLSLDNVSCEQMTLSLDMGSAGLDRITVDKSANVKLSAGSLYISRSELHNLNATCSLGDLYMDGTLTGTASLSLSMGSAYLSLDQKLSTISYRLDCSMGSVSINGGGRSGNASGTASDTKMLDLTVSNSMGSVDLTTR